MKARRRELDYSTPGTAETWTVHEYEAWGQKQWDIQRPSDDGSEIHVVATAFSKADADAILRLKDVARMAQEAVKAGYLRHTYSCGVITHGMYEPRPCDCGFDAFIEDLPTGQAGKESTR